MDIKTVESIQREDPSEETLELIRRRKEVVGLGDYRFTQGQWKLYNPPRTLKAEQKNCSRGIAKKRQIVVEEDAEHSQ